MNYVCLLRFTGESRWVDCWQRRLRMDQQSHHLGFVLLEFFCVSIGRVHRTFSWLCSMFLISTISAIYLYNFALQVQNTTFINCSTNSSLVRTSDLSSGLVTFFLFLSLQWVLVLTCTATRQRRRRHVSRFDDRMFSAARSLSPSL